MELFAADLNVEVPGPDTDLFEAGILDSLKFVELLVRLEDVFGRKFSLEELEIDSFRSVSRIAALVAGTGSSVAGFEPAEAALPAA